jgi:serine/threonine protein kinase
MRIAEALTIASQIANALDAAHERGIVHRDLKPANIMITAEGVVSARLRLATSTASWTSLATMRATHENDSRDCPYMSPEQARGQAVDKRTDIRAFSCIL